MSDVVALKAPAAVRTGWRDYLELSKARIVVLVLVTTAAGFVLAVDAINAPLLFSVLLGTGLVAGGTNALNQYIERDLDGQMERTRRRPLPAGRMTTRAALNFAVTVAFLGIFWLAVMVNLLASFLSAVTLLSYLFVYTPLKRRTPLSTVVGAFPGAIPPLIGWAGATGRLDLGAWILFAVMFLWQLPHFMAIGWIYREDYTRAGFSVLSVRDTSGKASGRQALLYGLALVPVSLLPVLMGLAGFFYLAVAVLGGAILLIVTVEFARERTGATARRLFLTSNLYLVLLMSALLSSHALAIR